MSKYYFLADDVVNKQLDNTPLITAKDTDYHNKEFNCLPSFYYPYFNIDESFCFYVIRWLHGKAEGSGKQARPYIRKQELNKWQAKAPASLRPLYNLLELSVRPDAIVLIVEGEKTAEAAKLLFPDYVVTTSSGGANGSNSSDWSSLKKRKVIIAPDNGKAGQKYAESVLKQLKSNYVNDIRFLLPKTLGEYVINNNKWVKRATSIPDSYDLADALEEGWTKELIDKAVIEFKHFFLSFNKSETIVEDNENVYENEEVLQLQNHKFKLGGNRLFLERFIEKPSLLDADGNLNDFDLNVEKIQLWTPICGYLKVTHHIRDMENGNWGTLLNMVDIDGKKKDIIIHKKDLAVDKAVLELLLDKGLEICHLKKISKNLLTCDLLNDYINTSKPQKRAIGVDTVGWHSDCYILPYVDNLKNVYFIQSNKQTECEREEYILQSNSVTPRRLVRNGTLKSWQDNIGELARDNTVPVFSCAAALAPLLLKPLGEDGCCFHFSGSSSIGKSTGLYIAGSIWGMEELSSFRSTDNAAESLCKNSNDGLLLMDELAQGKVEAIEQIAYLFGNGKGKARANRKGEAKPISNFKILGLSSGEIGLAAKLAEKGKGVTAGQNVRFIEIDADMGKGFGVFNTLHGLKDGDTLSKALQKRTPEHNGIVIDEFAKYITSNFAEVKAKAYSIIDDWLNINVPPEADGQVFRVARKFALVAAAGEIAIEAKILPFEKFSVGLHCTILFRNWLNKRGGSGSQEFTKIIDRLTDLLQKGINSRFLNADGTDENKSPKDNAGYKKIGTDGTIEEFWINPNVFTEEIMQHRDTKVFYPQLIKGGFIIPDKDGIHKPQKRCPSQEKQRRFFVVPASKFSEE